MLGEALAERLARVRVGVAHPAGRAVEVSLLLRRTELLGLGCADDAQLLLALDDRRHLLAQVGQLVIQLADLADLVFAQVKVVAALGEQLAQLILLGLDLLLQLVLLFH